MKPEYLEYLGIVVFFVAVYMIIQSTTEDIYGVAQLMGGMILASVSSPCIGFILRRVLTKERIEDPMRMYILLVALNIMLSAASLGLTLLAEAHSWKMLSPIGTAIIGIMPFLASFFEVE